MKGIIKMHKETLNELTNESQKWELIKMEIRNATLKYSKTQAYYNKEYESNLVTEYQVVTEVLEKQHTEELEKRLLIIQNALGKI